MIQMLAAISLNKLLHVSSLYFSNITDKICFVQSAETIESCYVYLTDDPIKLVSLRLLLMRQAVLLLPSAVLLLLLNSSSGAGDEPQSNVSLVLIMFIVLLRASANVHTLSYVRVSTNGLKLICCRLKMSSRVC